MYKHFQFAIAADTSSSILVVVVVIIIAEQLIKSVLK